MMVLIQHSKRRIRDTGHVGMMEAIGEELMAVKWIIICNERRCVPVFAYVKCF